MQEKNIASDKQKAQEIADLCDKSKTKISEKRALDVATTLTKKRSVNAIITKSVESQTDYEKRYYKRNFHKDESLDKVYNCTNKSTNDIINEFVCFVVDTKKTSFMTNDLITQFQTFGSSYGDIIRRAMRQLKKIKAVKIVNIKRKDSNKNLYKYVVNTESDLFKDFFKNETEIAKI